MKCPNPDCQNTALGKNHDFCFKCGCKIKKKEEPSSPSGDGNDKTPVTNAEFCDLQEDTDGSLGKIGGYKFDTSYY